MELNTAGIELIKSFESCKLTCYPDAIGLPTIGWGHRTDLAIGATIDQTTANKLLIDDLRAFSEKVANLLEVDLNDNQFSALVSFAYNCGVHNLASSTLLKLVNSSDFEQAANEFHKWDRAAGNELAGLLRRRLAEKALFLTPT
jgi:lysozyme